MDSEILPVLFPYPETFAIQLSTFKLGWSEKNILLKFWVYNTVQWNFLLLPEPWLITLISFFLCFIWVQNRLLEDDPQIMLITSHLCGLQYHQYSWWDNSYFKVCCSIRIRLHCAKQDIKIIRLKEIQHKYQYCDTIKTSCPVLYVAHLYTLAWSPEWYSSRNWSRAENKP